MGSFAWKRHPCARESAAVTVQPAIQGRLLGPWRLRVCEEMVVWGVCRVVDIRPKAGCLLSAAVEICYDPFHLVTRTSQLVTDLLGRLSQPSAVAMEGFSIGALSSPTRRRVGRASVQLMPGDLYAAMSIL